MTGAFAVLLLAGCSHEEVGPVTAHASEFTAAGPWAAEFAESAATASAYQKAILSDGKVTADELAEAQNRASSCMKDFGYDYTTAEDGTSEASPLPGRKARDAETVNEYMLQCSGEFDSAVTYLFNEVRRNPEKQDEAKMTVACLREAGLVDGSYTERLWRAEYDEGVFSFSEWDPAAVQCRLDPLGLWRTP
ncbi:hypothetical protein P9139_07660 [Curtobacterium flaccumfaciens]|nr:hypothetical protein P9139_07660 [Curtobacterium flaccumfaciens]